MPPEMESKIDNRLPKKYEELEVGYEFPPVGYKLTPAIVSKFEEAVETRSSATNLVPPLAIVAYTIKVASQLIDIPPGSIHASQEVEFFKPVTIGSCVNCHTKVIEKISRANLNILVIGLGAFDQDGELVLSARTTLILPC